MTESVASQSIDSALACLVMLARFHNVAADHDHLRHEFATNGQHFGMTEILLAAKKLGLKAKNVIIKPERLAYTPLPAIAWDAENNFVILARLQEAQSTESSDAGMPVGIRVLIHDPREDRPQLIALDDFFDRWTGRLVLMASQHSLAAELSRFDFTWFIPSVVKYRRLLGEVLAASFVLQLFALVTPLFFQVVMDKVLVHHGLTTLDVIAVGLLVVSIFEIALSALRSYIFSHTASRIDVELGAKLFRHLLALPTAWFAARRVGDSVARVRELENIRSFLTGNVITLLMDVVFSVVFIAVMLYYSGWLTLIVLVSLPCYAAVSVLATPLLRARLHEKFNRSSENQSFLVETVSAIDTVKSMAVEPQFTQKWDHQLAGYVSAAFRTNVVATLAHNSVDLIGKLVTVTTLWIGARLVIEGKLTVGQLIAFNMLAGHVAQPIIRLAQLWTDFQQVGISMQRLGDILNTPVEAGSASRMSLPPIVGRVEFDQVTFRYRPDGTETLRDISFVAEPGKVFGLVGRSGSGKSTLAKLIQRLYVPERGRILVDGVDLALADPIWLRRQVGVVLQENILFNRSIRDNIALSDPGAPIEAVIGVAKLAGAHDFILELPNGYDTLVGEHGTGLSGGQRQRIAIARALLTSPRILIFDEATSALDYESERIIQNNMQAICKDRTVFIIAHRLSAVRHADCILVMERGSVAESGSHRELLENQHGIYSHLHALQQG